jgi:DNA polymerase alpha-associated DNA helicase A
LTRRINIAPVDAKFNLPAASVYIVESIVIRYSQTWIAFRVMISADQQIAAFIARQRLLLSREREEEITRSSLLLSNCGTKLLEQKGLALTGLSVVDVKIGLGGKMCVRFELLLTPSLVLVLTPLNSLVELERPTAYHATPIFPPNTFR